MALAEVVKIGILGLVKDQDKVLDVVYDFGEMQLVKNQEEKSVLVEDLSELEYNLAQLKFSLDFVNRYKLEEKIGLRAKLIAALNKGIDVSQDKIRELVKNFDYQEVVKKAEDLEGQINLKESKIASLKAEIEEIRPWVAMDFNYQKAVSEKIRIKIGVLETAKSEELTVKIGGKKLPVEMIKLKPGKKQLQVVLIYVKKVSQEVEELLAEAEFKEVNLPELSDVPIKVVAAKDREIKKLEKEIKKFIKEAAALSKHEKSLKIVFDYLSWQRDKLEAAQLANRGKKTFSLVGFIDKDRIGSLEERLLKKTKNVHVVEMLIGEDEDVPVMLKNNVVVSPFESVTNIYGAPKRVELDPTPYLAPFFILFFGLCLSDAGYGFLLALFSFLAIKILKVPRKKQGFFRLLVYAGISTFIIGALFGGWFGLVLDELPKNGLTNLLLSIKMFDPVSNPLTMLIFSLILGGFQVIVGVTINLFYQLKRKDWSKSFDSGAWLFFLLGIVFWLVAGNVLANQGLAAMGKYWIWAAAAILVLTQGRKQKNIFLKLPLGALSLYNVVGYFSDVMSYSRLLALGLSTGIIAMVINMVAMLFKDMIPWVGWFVAITILIGGHLFNLAINALGSFIHSGRLQYVEFFPKFMEGGGTRFRPLKKTAKYINLDY